MTDTPDGRQTAAVHEADTHELKLVSWNVNGLRALVKKDPGFLPVFDMLGADVFALQET